MGNARWGDAEYGKGYAQKGTHSVLVDNRELNPIRRTALQTLHPGSGCEIFFGKLVRISPHRQPGRFGKGSMDEPYQGSDGKLLYRESP